MKISFDFDSTLSTKRIQRLATKLISEGHEVWITTSRFPNSSEVIQKWPWIKDQNNLLFKLAQELQIPICRIQFTSMEPKWKVLNGFDMHYDDDQVEIEMLEENESTCLGILIHTPYIYEEKEKNMPSHRNPPPPPPKDRIIREGKKPIPPVFKTPKDF